MLSNSGTLTAVNDVVGLNVGTFNSAVIHVRGGAVAPVGANVSFEASVDSTNGIDGTWFAIQAVRTNANTLETSSGALGLAIGAGNPYAWRINVANINFLRVRLNAVTSGNLFTIISASTAMAEVAPGIGAHSVTVSNSPAVTVTSGAITNTPANPTNYNLVSAASTNAANIKNAAGNLYEITVSNVTATAAFIKLYNKASAPTVGTDVPILTIPATAGATVPINFGALGKRFTAGISIAITAAAAATDTGVTVAGIQVNASYV